MLRPGCGAVALAGTTDQLIAPLGFGLIPAACRTCLPSAADCEARAAGPAAAVAIAASSTPPPRTRPRTPGSSRGRRESVMFMSADRPIHNRLREARPGKTDSAVPCRGREVIRPRHGYG